MNPLKKLFKQTFVYGLATVLPRMLSFLLLYVHTDVLDTGSYGEVSKVFAWFAIFNVLLAYGMETAFFRFFHSEEKKNTVVSTSLISIFCSSILFLILALLAKSPIAIFTNIDEVYIKYVIYILVLDALTIIPFAWLRANEKPIKFALIKMLNVVINMGLSIVFLYWLPIIVENDLSSVFKSIYKEDYQISYIFIANLVASAVTLLLVIKLYFTTSYIFDKALWKKMMKYAAPVLVAGIAFTINEVFDRILLDWLLPPDIAESEIGKYSACYKLALFMVLFATAFRMGVEPFFFSHSKSENPQKTYAEITNYFVIIGSVILLTVIVFIDFLKKMFVPNEAYWEAMPIVPIILLAAFFLGIYHNLSVWYKVTDKTRYGAFISIIGAVLTIIINIVFIPSIGYVASALATLIAYGTMMFLSYYFGKKNYPIPYNIRKITFYFSISLVLSILSFYVFKSNLWIGIPLLLLFLGLVYKMEVQTLKKIFIKK